MFLLIIWDTIFCIKTYLFTKIFPTKRNCNKVADALEKKSRVWLELQVWVEDLPGDIIFLALFDVHSFLNIPKI